MVLKDYYRGNKVYTIQVYNATIYIARSIEEKGQDYADNNVFTYRFIFRHRCTSRMRLLGISECIRTFCATIDDGTLERHYVPLRDVANPAVHNKGIAG